MVGEDGQVVSAATEAMMAEGSPSRDEAGVSDSNLTPTVTIPWSPSVGQAASPPAPASSPAVVDAQLAARQLMFAAFLEAEDDTLRALSALRNGTSRHPGVVPGQTRLRKLAQVDSLRIDIHALARCFGRIKGVLVASKMFVDDFGATASSFVLAPILLHYMPKMSAVMTRMLDAWQRAMAWTRVEDFVLFWTFFALGAGAQETTLMSQVSLHEPATPSRPPRFARHSVDSAPASHPSAIDTRTGMADDDDLALGDVVVMSPSLHSVEAYLLLPLVRLVNAHRQICRIAALTTTSHPDARVLGLNATILASLAGRALSLIERH